jgi:glutamate-5-semialdehyde dehydrogenase
VLKTWRAGSGVTISKVSVPLGVIAVIYESRPNVTADASGLCLKSGNAVILRGGKEAYRSNVVIAETLRGALEETGFPADAVQMLATTDREASIALMRLRDIDVLIPRGGAALKRSVEENARVPYIMTAMGNCHVFIDESADLANARNITINAKCQRPGVCNAIETLLVHRNLSDEFISSLLGELISLGVRIRGDERIRSLCAEAAEATDDDWYEEYLDLILAVKTVGNVEEAIAHIEKYGTRHSDCIVTENYTNALKFQSSVDSAAVYVNASTRFTDGGEFGFGAEMGISTQKLHARGPIGPEQLTAEKYIVNGTGQIRP